MTVEEIAKDIYMHHFDDDVNYPEVLKAITVGVQKGYTKAKTDMRFCGNCAHSEEDNKSPSVCDDCFELCNWEMRR